MYRGLMANIIIVSNRLPVSVKRKEDGQLEFYPSAGGLATGLASYANNRHNKWIGWPGIASDDLTPKEIKTITKELKKQNCYPVFLTQKQLDGYYNGYSNGLLWPLFHSMPTKMDTATKYWKMYKEVNTIFADIVTDFSQSDSTIWVHDYQLLLLPQMLRRMLPNSHIGFFLHIPFPSAKDFGLLPQAKQLLLGILGSDLVGLHITAYTKNFLDATQAQNIGIAASKQLILEDRTVRIADFPIGIDYDKFHNASLSRGVKRAARKLRRHYRGCKIILTVDRMEPSKGLVERLKAYRDFLVQNPKVRRHVVMMMLAVPSRTEIKEYQRLKQKVENLVNEINATFGTRRWQPVDFMFKSVPFEELAAMYQVADVAFIAPIRDGMNLVAKEYIASKPRKDGVLILSETAGAAQELTDAILVNPRKQKSLVDALNLALTMSPKELKQRLSSMQKDLSVHTIQHWAEGFIDTLTEPHTLHKPRIKLLGIRSKKQVVEAFEAAKKRLIVLDYDGTLTPFFSTIEGAKPTKSLIKLINKLAALPRTEVVLISGRAKADLDNWFKDLPIALVAEHGAFIKHLGKDWRQTDTDTPTWKAAIRPIMEKYTAAAPGTFIEEKQHSLVWHYRQALPYYARKNLLLLKQALKPIVRAHHLGILQGNKVLEVKPPHINKGDAMRFWFNGAADFIMVIGDDKTDEDMFKTAPDSAYTIKVRPGKTNARWRLSSTDTVIKFLGRFV